MGVLLSMLAVLILFVLALLLLSVGFGWLLVLIFPSIDFGIAVLTSLIAVGIAIHFMVKAISSMNQQNDEGRDDGDFQSRITYLIDPEPTRRRRRRSSPKGGGE